MSRRKGWRKPANTAYAGRPGKFGNPFHAQEHGRERAAELYGQWIQEAGQRGLLMEARLALRGKNLGCWCRLGEPCHADILLRLVNQQDDESVMD
jgi:hypothetical protein